MLRYKKTVTIPIFVSLFLFLSNSLSAQTGPPFPDNVYDMDCSIHPSASQWSIAEKDTSTFPAPYTAQLFAGDIDNDGEVEIIAVGQSANIIIYDRSLNLKSQIGDSSSFYPYYSYGLFPVAIADADHDGIAEIFVILRNSSGIFFRCFNYTGSNLIIKWEITLPQNNYLYSYPVIADVNADGIPDILIQDRIYNAQTGELEVELPVAIGSASDNLPVHFNMPVLADMDNDGLLEVVGGNTVIKIDILNPHGTAGNNAYIWKSMSDPIAREGLTSVADIDLDGYMDVIVNVIDFPGANYLYIWKPYTGVNSSPSVLASFPYDSTSGSLACSRVLIADFDNDCYPEMAWSYTQNIQACKYNPVTQSLDSLWRHATSDQSGHTGMSAFDFNQDGFLEIVYRDETHLRIIDGITGLNKSAISCFSGTSTEYPIIVDIDNDGAAEILASEDISLSSADSRIRSFKSGSNVNWAPARPVWNQYSYNVVHINNDLTVPQNQFNPVSTFVDPNNPGDIRRPFNNFLQQATIINQYGVPFIPAADAIFIQDSTQVSNLCDSVTVVLYIHNQGNTTLAAPYKITTYKNLYQGDIIRTDHVLLSLAADSSYRITLTFTSSELAAFLPITNMVFAVNDAGNGIAQNGGQQAECDTLNNLLVVPFPLSPDTTTINVQLPTDTTICRGNSITAISNQVTSWLWSDGTAHAELFPANEGIYTLTASVNNCLTDTFSVNIHFFEPAAVDLGNDTVLCHFMTLLLDAQHPSAQSYLWQDSSTNSTYTVYSDGRYWVIVTDHCGQTSDTTNIDYLVELQVNFGNDTTLCDGETLLLDATMPYCNYLWQDGSTEPTYFIAETGCYSVSVSNLCFTVSDTICVETENCDPDIEIPNVFTPNNDGFNDVFIPEFHHPEHIVNYSLFIYNRWGWEVFHSNVTLQGWDGYHNNNACSEGSYFYILEYTNQKGKAFSFNGTVTLIR